MIDFLIIQIKLGRITFDQVPEQYKKEVKEKLGEREV